jgi:hypothetical protein
VKSFVRKASFIDQPLQASRAAIPNTTPFGAMRQLGFAIGAQARGACTDQRPGTSGHTGLSAAIAGLGRSIGSGGAPHPPFGHLLPGGEKGIACALADWGAQNDSPRHPVRKGAGRCQKIN